MSCVGPVPGHMDVCSLCDGAAPVGKIAASAVLVKRDETGALQLTVAVLRRARASKSVKRPQPPARRPISHKAAERTNMAYTDMICKVYSHNIH